MQWRRKNLLYIYIYLRNKFQPRRLWKTSFRTVENSILFRVLCPSILLWESVRRAEKESLPEMLLEDLERFNILECSPIAYSVFSNLIKLYRSRFSAVRVGKGRLYKRGGENKSQNKFASIKGSVPHIYRVNFLTFDRCVWPIFTKSANNSSADSNSRCVIAVSLLLYSLWCLGLIRYDLGVLSRAGTVMC